MADLSFVQYQERAAQTDQFVPDGVLPADRKARARNGLLSAVLGIAEKAGLACQVAKRLLRGDRDVVGPREQEQVELTHALGDVLWYMACVCRHLDVSLADVAAANLRRSEEIYSRSAPHTPEQPLLEFMGDNYGLLDASYPVPEQLPRKCSVRFEHREAQGEQLPYVAMLLIDSSGKAGPRVGDVLNDNSRHADGYRCHDAFHFAYMAVLGWSPVMRSLLDCKRRSNQRVDEFEDGGRARDIEEGLTAFIFQRAELHDFFGYGNERLPTDLLTTVRGMVRHLEVRDRTENDWDRAIREGLRIFGQMRGSIGGRLDVRMRDRSLSFRATKQPMATAPEPSAQRAPEDSSGSA